MLKTKFLVPLVVISLGIIIGVFYWAGIFSSKAPSSETAKPISPEARGIAITPKSAREFLTDPDIERWAVIVGISDYKNNPQIADLKYADRDAQAFYNFLISAQGGAFQPDHIQLLTNEKATVSNLRRALGTFLGRTADKDLVIIFMAGHGAPDPKKWENLYFLTYDADPNSLPNTAYPMWEMETALQRFIKAKRVIVITDACHSAALSGGMIAMRGQDGYRVSEYMKKLVESREGCTFITASRAGEGSQESEQWGGGHGVFTYFLLEGLKGKADRNRDGFVTIKETYDYLYPKVQRESENGQTPFASAYLDNSIPLGICEPEKLGLTSLPISPPTGQPGTPTPIKETTELLEKTKAIELNPQDAIAYSNRGLAYFHKGDYDRAIAEYTRAIELNPRDAETYAKRGSAYIGLGDNKKAIESFKQAIGIKPDEVIAHCLLGLAYRISGDYQKAIESYKEAVRIKPDFAEAHLGLGTTYGCLGKYTEEVKALKQAIRIKPDLAGAHLGLGTTYGRLGKYAEAVKFYKEAIRIKPDDAEAHYYLGNTYNDLGKHTDAIKSFKQAIGIKPDDASVHFNLGSTYGKIGDNQKAIESFKQAIRIRPDFAEAHFNLGSSYGRLGDEKKAIESYKQAIRIKPDLAGAHFSLGGTYLIAGDRSSALEEYKILKELDKELANELFNLIYGE